MLYFLYVGICITAFIIKRAARTRNGNKNVFTGKELEIIVWNALIATSVYYFVFAIRDHATSFLSFAGLIVALLTGFLFSLGDGLSNDDKDGLLQYFKRTIIILLKNCMSLVSAASILSVVIVFAVDYMLKKQSLVFKFILAVVGIVFACLIVVYIICQIQKKNIIKRIKKYAIGKNVLILEYTPYGDIIRSIIRSLKHSDGKHKVLKSKSDIHKKHYDIIVIVNHNFQSSRLLLETKDYICEGGILIAPAYTSNRRKKKPTRLQSPQDYLSQLNKHGWVVADHFNRRLAGITYAELKRTKT